MKSKLRLILIALIILVFGTFPAAFAQDLQETPDIVFSSTGSLVACGDSLFDTELGLPEKIVDYYQIDLFSGQRLKVDVDAQAIGSNLDYILQLFDINGNSLADGDDNLNDEVAPLDPSLEYTATDTGLRTYIVAVSINILYLEELPNIPDPYHITFECTDVGPVSPLEPGDLLASTGTLDGLLIRVDRETGIVTDFRGPLGQHGEVFDIEFRDDGVLFGVAIDVIDEGDGATITAGTIITIDPNSGVETWVGTLESGSVIALEFGGDPVSLYGIYLASDGADSQLGTIDQGTGALTFVEVGGGHTGYKRVDGLAYDSRTGTMYGIGDGSDGIDLMTIDLATGLAKKVGTTGSKIQILAIEFGPDGNLYGVTAPFKSEDGTFVANLVTIDTLQGTATTTASLAVGSSFTKVNGLTFKPGWEPQSGGSKVITSQENNPFVGRVIDKFKFEGTQGEFVTITVENLNKTTEDELSQDYGETSPEAIKTTSKWSEKHHLANKAEVMGRAFLTLRDAISDVDLRVSEKGQMTLAIDNVQLPATGLYYIILMQPVPRALRVDYSLTMTSSLSAFKTLEATRLIEPRVCKNSEEEVTLDNTEQQSGVITLKSTSLNSTDESTSVIPEEPADDGVTKLGPTIDGITNGDEPVNEGDSEDGAKAAEEITLDQPQPGGDNPDQSPTERLMNPDDEGASEEGQNADSDLLDESSGVEPEKFPAETPVDPVVAGDSQEESKDINDAGITEEITGVDKDDDDTVESDATLAN